MMPATRFGRPEFHGVIGPGRYLAAGVLLAAVKLPLDYLLAAQVFGRPWSPADYAFPNQLGGVLSLDRDDQIFYVSMLALALPFLVVGLALTVRRLRDAGWPIWIAAMFFAPAPLNIVFFLVLALTPSLTRPRYAPPEDFNDVPTAKSDVRHPRSSPGRALAAILIPMPIAAGIIYLGTHVFRDYGWSVFVGLPFVLPMISVIIYGYHAPRTRGQCLGLGLSWILVATLLLLASAYEGLICILMALPLALPVVMLGVMVGYFIISTRTRTGRGLGKMLTLLLAMLPAMIGAEHATLPEPPLFEVTSVVEVDAAPDRVWRRVIAFPDLTPPTDPVFLAGIAYPIRARIEGRGVGAVRYCEFSTGAFVEPIEIWEENRLLRFGVTSNPPPMREWNPFFEIHPPHLEGFLVSRRGQFCLTALPGGRTRLEGTTWYHHGLWPAGYWRLWSDAILHRIHSRVLEHIKALAEGESEPTLKKPSYASGSSTPAFVRPVVGDRSLETVARVLILVGRGGEDEVGLDLGDEDHGRGGGVCLGEDDRHVPGPFVGVPEAAQSEPAEERRLRRRRGGGRPGRPALVTLDGGILGGRGAHAS